MKQLLLTALLCVGTRAAEPAPELAGGRAWLNIAAPLTLASLRGKVVLLDFADDWSVAGRASLRMMRDLQSRYPAGLVVIGVRSPRPGRPPETLESLRVGVLRNEVSHPVIDDGDGKIAAAYGAKDRPFLIALGPDGAVLGAAADVSSAAAVVGWIGTTMQKVLQDPGLPPVLALERDKAPDAPWAFPTQISFDPIAKILYVADPGNNRIVGLRQDGRVAHALGNFAPTFRDGILDGAGFDHPEAAVAWGADLFIADAENDLIRRASLAKKSVLTYAGANSLRKPRGLALVGDTLYIASAGTSRVNAVDLKTGHYYAFAGDGKSGTKDGMLATAQLMEPTAVAVLGKTLWIADAEAGTLRSLDMETPELVTPRLTGPGLPLARPSAFASEGTTLLIADAGDGKVKRLDPKTGLVTIFTDGLLQPSGVAVAGDEVIVSDTGRSRLLRFTKDGKALGVLEPRGLKGTPHAPPMSDIADRQDVLLEPQKVRSGKKGELLLSFRPPDGFKLNPRAAQSYKLLEARGPIHFSGKTRDLAVDPKKPMKLEFIADAGRTEAILSVDLYYCRQDGTGLCRSTAKRYRVLIDGAPNEKARAVTVVVEP